MVWEGRGRQASPYPDAGPGLEFQPAEPAKRPLNLQLSPASIRGILELPIYNAAPLMSSLLGLPQTS